MEIVNRFSVPKDIIDQAVENLQGLNGNNRFYNQIRDESFKHGIQFAEKMFSPTLDSALEALEQSESVFNEIKESKPNVYEGYRLEEAHFKTACAINELTNLMIT